MDMRAFGKDKRGGGRVIVQFNYILKVLGKRITLKKQWSTSEDLWGGKSHERNVFSTVNLAAVFWIDWQEATQEVRLIVVV